MSNPLVKYALEQRDTIRHYIVAAHLLYKHVLLPIAGIALLPVVHPRQLG